ncbi:MAG: permease [Bacillota bacterium]|nr:permease [Bacillota bacterium]
MTLEYELKSLFNLIIVQFRQIFPYWIAGTIVGSILSVYFSGSLSALVAGMKKVSYNFPAAFAAAVLGVASPICMYGTIPLIASLGKKGVPQYILATFMISSIMLNPNLFLMSFALGSYIALLRLVSCLAAGLLAGILVYVFYKDKELFNFKAFKEKESCTTNKYKKSFWKDINKSITITAPYFLIGIVITALFDRYFPKELIISMFSSNKGLGVLLAASMGVPVYVCGGGTIPLLAAFLKNGMSAGSAVAFMITGPATKLTNLSAVKAILGFRNFILYIVFNMTIAVVCGVTVDLLYAIIK